MTQCSYCQKETSNPKFCSRSCATSSSNKTSPRRKKTKKCRNCGKIIYSEYIYCSNECLKDIQKLRPKLSKEELKKANVRNVIKWRQRLKERAVEYKGGKCQICGYSKCIKAFDFHHLQPEHKDFSISRDGNCRSWDTIKPELDKCALVCSNCHREIHAEVATI